jgi:SNF2 family DNA or RNA helicase
MTLFKKYLDFSGLEHKSYQYEGVRWCLQNELRSDGIIKGGFIADEMGLGKTILMIGTFVAHFVPKTLIVVPLVLLEQWSTQIYKTTGHKAIIYHGEKRWNLDLSKAIIVITTYDMIADLSIKKKMNKEKSTSSLLHKIHWDRVVFDEGHHLRNHKTLKYSGALKLKAGIRWLVSGTPVQNKKKDFYNLCAIFGINNVDANYETIARDFVLKRTKKQVGIDIGDVCLNRELVHWKNKKELELSKEIHSCLSFSKLSTTSGAGLGLGLMVRLFGEEVLFNHLVMMIKARQCCILPRLINKKVTSSSGLDDLNLDDLNLDEGLCATSKIDCVVHKILQNKSNGNGKLVFCHFKEEMDVIKKRLLDGGITRVECFDGRVPFNKRKEILNSGSEVLILQIQTGCEGLNLQENYSEIYFVSPHWNPAVEDQAVARCHRLGQKKQVKVYKFEMSSFLDDEDGSDSAEEVESTFSLDGYVNNVQNKKRMVANEVFA